MNITLTGTKITQDTKFLAFEKNSGVDVITITVDTDESWEYKLDVKYPEKCCTGEDLYNIIALNRDGDICSVELTSKMLPFAGKYTMQLRAINGDKVKHSDTFDAWVKYSIEPGSTYDPVPSEFYQIEQNITKINNHPPKPGNNGYWLIWNVETKQYEESNIPLSDGTLPEVSDDTKGWYLTNDGEKVYWAEVQAGTEGKIDSIEVNGVEQPIVNKTVNIAVPAKTSDLSNDSGYITNKELSDYATKDELPTKVSQLENDSGFISESALDGYAKTADIPTKVGQLDNDVGYINAEQAKNAAPVQSVNGQTGVVVIDIPEAYELPIASSTQLGGVQPDDKTAEQTVPVGVDKDGKLWVKAATEIDTILAEKVMFDSDMVFTEQFGKYTPSGGKVTIPSNGKSLKGLLLDAYSEDKKPTITQPSAGISSSTAKAYEVGTVVTPVYSGTFNAGKYEYGPTPTGVAVTEWQAANNTTTETKATQTGTFATYTVPDGANYRITIKATYSDGAIPVTALGAQYEAGKIVASSKTAQSGAITGYRNSFYGTLADKSTAITNVVIRALQQKSGKALANGNTFTVNIPVGAESVLIAYPAILRDVTSIKDVNGLNADITSAFTSSTMDVTGANDYTAISYKLYRLDYAKPNDAANKYTVTI